jgi:hypothetical protein
MPFEAEPPGNVSGKRAFSAWATHPAGLRFSWPQMIGLAMSALVAGLTVGGKAIGKTFAIGSCTYIVQNVGKMIWALNNISKLFSSKRNKK